MLTACQEVLDHHGDNMDVLLDVGVLFLNSGFLERARKCFERAQALAADDDPRAAMNLANLARDASNHQESRQLYAALLERFPNHSMIRRNLLVSLEYDPEVSDTERLAQAKDWGAWAVARAGGHQLRPSLHPLNGRPLRVGYVSADFCQHTVGLFVKDVLKAHDPARVSVFAYSAGTVRDWVTEQIRSNTKFRDVTALDDTALVKLICQDKIDLLVDLSGHTAGSRLTAFAHRPAPVQVSWLGYFATTGLASIDAVLLDEWHAPPGTEGQFIEPIMRLAGGRFCYQPVPWAPTTVSPAPVFSKGYITFGSFNNTGKLNNGVFNAWAQILAAVPNSRLVLKWRNFNDDDLRQSVLEAFSAYGIHTHRIELRGPSFHDDLLKEYAEIDIALDPFPFTGGLTSCEALWMGVPVVTWPQSRVVSRQTYALLSAIGLSDLAAKDANDYVRIALELSGDQARLAELRSYLREQMQTSLLMDVAKFTQQLEQTLINLYDDILGRQEISSSKQIKTILHVGCGHRQNGARLPAIFYTSEWREIRLDIDPNNEPDIIGSMLNMTTVTSSSVDAIYSSHNIEHVYAHEVPIVMKEFLRVLKPDGFLVATCPDLQSVSALVAEDKLVDVVYKSPAGPITPLDILYGHGAALAAGHHYMAHKCGFTLKTLTQALLDAGFTMSAGKRRARGLDLWVVAIKSAMEAAALRELAERVLPN